MKFGSELELDLDIECDISDPENPKIKSVEFHGVDITKALKRRQIGELQERAKEKIQDVAVSLIN